MILFNGSIKQDQSMAYLYCYCQAHYRKVLFGYYWGTWKLWWYHSREKKRWYSFIWHFQYISLKICIYALSMCAFQRRVIINLLDIDRKTRKNLEETRSQLFSENCCGTEHGIAIYSNAIKFCNEVLSYVCGGKH